jgi:thiol-disulfide isomerase/thioredoxin
MGQRSNLVRTGILLAVLWSSFGIAHASAQATPPAEDAAPACVTEYEASRAEPGFAEPELAEWQSLTLVDARTGEEFSVSDFLGCTIYIEPMATWCINCLMQQSNVKEALPRLDPEWHIIISISIETELSNEDLAAYADNSEFDWPFAVASADNLKALVDEFGREVTVPPSTPYIIVYPDGTAGELRTGGLDADGIVELMTSEPET